MKKKVVAGILVGFVMCSLGFVLWIEWFAHTKTREGVIFGVSKGFYGTNEPVTIWVKNQRSSSIKISLDPAGIEKLSVKGWKTVITWYYVPERSITIAPGEKRAVGQWDTSKERGMYRVWFKSVEHLVGNDVALFFITI